MYVTYNITSFFTQALELSLWCLWRLRKAVMLSMISSMPMASPPPVSTVTAAKVIAKLPSAISGVADVLF